MSKNPTWANLAIVDATNPGICAITTLFVTESETSLSGAWLFDAASKSDLENVIERKIIVSNGANKLIDLKKTGSVNVEIEDFIVGARNRALESVDIFDKFVQRNAEEYKAYMAIPPAERKLLPKVQKSKLEPMYLNDWDLNVKLDNPGETLELLRKKSEILGTPENMKSVNQLSWLLKHLIDMWKQDEAERFARKQMHESFSDFQILPPTWLSQLNKIQEEF